MLILAAVAGLALGVGAGINSVASCVPSDFPEYPGTIWGGWAGGGNVCVDTRLTFGGASDIMSFYSSKLGNSPWKITGIDRTGLRIDFEHATGARIVGILWLVEQGPFRAICREFDRSPAVSGARPARLESLRAYSRRPVC